MWKHQLLLVIVLVAASGQPSDHDNTCPVLKTETCPDLENIKFYLYTRDNPDVPEVIVNTNVSSTLFNATNPTKIIIHGYNSDAKLFALVDARYGYLLNDDVNVIAVDWGLLSQGPILCYPTAVHNSGHVGHCVAQLTQILVDTGAVDIHVIGFSLGAQVAAFVANHLRPYQLPRITGLDPAMPMFVTSDNDKKLDASDAEYVDVFHTNSFIQGKIEQSGHVDFYFNGGTRQPGCGEFDFACSHVRAAVYFAESINSPTGFWGWSCPNYFMFIIQLCPLRQPDVIAGEHVANSTRGFYLVKTASKAPFALGQHDGRFAPIYTSVNT